MFGRKTWEKRFRDVGRELIKAAVAVNGLRVMEELPVTGISFDIKNPRAEAWIKRKVFEFAYKVNDTTEKDLRRALVGALDEGATIKEITGEVERIFGYAETYRNERIARTETISATNYGAYEAIKQSGIKTKKEWIATIDDRTRESHADLDGELAELDDTFSNGLMFPGDPNGEAAEVINCRCTIGHIFEDEEQGQSEQVEQEPPQEIFQYGQAQSIDEALEEIGLLADSVNLSGIELETLNQISATTHSAFNEYGLQKYKSIKTYKSKLSMARAHGFELEVEKSYFSKNKYFRDINAKLKNMNRDEKISEISNYYDNMIKVAIQEGSDDKHLMYLKKNKERAINQLIESSKYRQHNVLIENLEIESVLNHEIGHTVEDQIFGWMSSKRQLPGYANLIDSKKYMNRLINIFKNTKKTGAIKEISIYATTNVHEFFAECFALYRMDKSRLSAEIVEFFDEITELVSKINA